MLDPEKLQSLPIHDDKVIAEVQNSVETVSVII
jgi:hypothetical protein